MGRKKKSSGAGEGSSEAENSTKSNGATSMKVVGAAFVEGNGTVTKALYATISEVQEPVIIAVQAPEFAND